MEAEKFRYEFQGLDKIENSVFLNNQLFSICSFIQTVEESGKSFNLFLLVMSDLPEGLAEPEPSPIQKRAKFGLPDI